MTERPGARLLAEKVDPEPQSRAELEAALAEAEHQVAFLTERLVHRTLIGEAVGVLMAEEALSVDSAFSRLVDMASHRRMKVSDVATQIVELANARAAG